MKQDGVQGVLIADKEGLCIVRDGNVPSAAAGIARSIAIRSAEFFPRESNSSPLVVIETEESKVLIRGQDSGIISVVHKSK